MSVESQNGGKHDCGGPDICFTDETERATTPDDKYMFLKDGFSSVSSTSEIHSEMFLSKSKSYSDCGSSLQVCIINKLNFIIVQCNKIINVSTLNTILLMYFLIYNLG